MNNKQRHVYYVSFTEVDAAFKIEADSEDDAIQKARAMAIGRIDREIANKTVHVELWPEQNGL